MSTPTVSVLGAGSWGTALAHHLALAGAECTLWGRNEEILTAVSSGAKNPRYFPNEALAPGIKTTADILQAVAGRDLVVFAVPSAAVRLVAQAIKGQLQPSALVVSTAKGLEKGSLSTMTDVLSEELGEVDRITALAGPSFALEVIRGLPTAVTVAATEEAQAAKVAKFFHFKNLRVYTSTDIVGVEFGGIIKNVIALAAGLVDGVGMGNNARAALLTRGLAEMQRLITTLGGEATTVSGLSGLGDLLLTATGDLSRNRQVGLRLGQGEKLSAIIASLGQVAEAVATTQFVYQLAERHGVTVPIIEQVQLILQEKTTVAAAVEALLSRKQKSENT